MEQYEIAFSFALKESTKANEEGNEAADSMSINIIICRLLTVVMLSI